MELRIGLILILLLPIPSLRHAQAAGTQASDEDAKQELSLDLSMQKLEKKKVDALLLQVKLHLHLEDYGAAAEFLHRLSSSGLEDVYRTDDALVIKARNIALQLLKNDKPEESLRLATSIHPIAPDDSILLHIISLACDKSGKQAQADEWRKKAENNLRDEVYHYKTAQFFKRRKMYDIAAIEYKLITTIDPEDSVYDANAVLFLSSRSFDRKEYERAVQLMDEAYEIVKRKGYAFTSGGPRGVDRLYIHLAREYELRKDYEKELETIIGAEKHFDKPQPHLLAAKADALARLEKYDEAIQQYGKSIQLDDKRPHTYTGYGDALKEIDRKEDAEKAFSRAVELYTEIIDKAEKDYAKARMQASLHWLTGVTFIEVDRAERLAHRIQSINFNGLAWFYVTHDMKLEEAEKLSRKSLELRPDVSYCLDTLAEICYRRGRKEEAIQNIRKAIDTNPMHVLYYQQQLEKFQSKD